nr:hypothetical protein [Rhodovulum sp. ES.010]
MRTSRGTAEPEIISTSAPSSIIVMSWVTDRHDMFQVDPAFGFVEKHQPGVLQEQLEDFPALYLAARETDIHVAPQKVDKIECRSLAGKRLLGPKRRGEGPHRHAVEARRALERHPDTKPGPLLLRQVGKRLAVQPDRAPRHPVGRQPEDGRQQARLARAVGAEQNMQLAGFQRQIYARKNGHAGHVNMKVVDFEHGVST